MTRWVGETARAVLARPGTFVLHSVFDSSVNLVPSPGSRTLIHLSATKTGVPVHSPFGIEVDMSVWAPWSDAVRADRRRNITARWTWDPRRGRFRSLPSGATDLVLGADWREASGTSTVPTTGADVVLRTSTGLPGRCPTERRAVLAGSGLAPVMDTEALWSRVLAGVRALRAGRLHDADWLIGRGPGLTPSGDDVLVGMLGVLHCTGSAETADTSRLAALIADDGDALTTDVSCAYLRDACRGRFAGPLRQVLLALARSADEVAVAARDLCTLGHTSGIDTMVGLLAALEEIQTLPAQGETHLPVAS